MVNKDIEGIAVLQTFDFTRSSLVSSCYFCYYSFILYTPFGDRELLVQVLLVIFLTPPKNDSAAEDIVLYMRSVRLWLRLSGSF